MIIRDFEPKDCDRLVEILKANQQYGQPETEGPEAMLRVYCCPAAVFLVAEEDNHPVGFIRGVYDGSRALIHIVSVDPEYQRRGIGRALVQRAANVFKERGAVDLAVTVPGDIGFWKRLGFRVTTRIMLAHPIDDVAVP